MNLVNLSSERQRTSFVMRFCCCLLCVSLLLCVVCPPRAHAVVSETVAIAIVAAYLASCGLSLAADGLNENGTTAAIVKMVEDFLNIELGGVSISEWANGLFSAGLMVKSGVAYIPADAAVALSKFADWVKDKYGDTPGQSSFVSSSQSFTALDGKTYALTVAVPDSEPSLVTYFHSFQIGTSLVNVSDFIEDPNFELVIPVTEKYSYRLYRFSNKIYWSDGTSFSDTVYHLSNLGSDYTVFGISFIINSRGYLVIGNVAQDSSDVYYEYRGIRSSGVKATDLNITGGSLSVGVTKGVTIPKVLADQALQLNTGNPDISTPEEFADDVIGSVIDGNITADAEIVDATDVPAVEPTVQPTVEPTVEPTAPPIDTDIPDIDGLGLGALSAALVTRFPFSIPWDFTKGVKLLAAPAKAPYWEVDLFEPIAYRVGGWKGDTKIVIDMSQFEIIGQLSRWTSTIGFCLILASGTKRLIWTA